MSSPDNKYRVDFEQSIERYSDMVYRIAVTITKNEEDEITEIREYIDEDSFDNWG